MTRRFSSSRVAKASPSPCSRVPCGRFVLQVHGETAFFTYICRRRGGQNGFPLPRWKHEKNSVLVVVGRMVGVSRACGRRTAFPCGGRPRPPRDGRGRGRGGADCGTASPPRLAGRVRQSPRRAGKRAAHRGRHGGTQPHPAPLRGGLAAYRRAAAGVPAAGGCRGDAGDSGQRPPRHGLRADGAVAPHRGVAVGMVGGRRAASSVALRAARWRPSRWRC